MTTATPPPHASDASHWQAALRREGHVFLRGEVLRPLLDTFGSLADWATFAASWDGMPLDTYMADGGRYRRRRHATFSLDADGHSARLPHQAHFQSRDYNALNGGVERWFEAIPQEIGDSAALRTLLAFCAAAFGALAADVKRWHVETHQFRIEANAETQGLPTPEGMHRDGVDYVLVLLVRRVNIARGVTTIHAPDGADLGSFTLTAPFDATLIDDARVFHGVTAVEAIEPTQPAFRDVLVVTLRRQAP